jgi:tetratricopeptide (TPR) repeat protein
MHILLAFCVIFLVVAFVRYRARRVENQNMAAWQALHETADALLLMSLTPEQRDPAMAGALKRLNDLLDGPETKATPEILLRVAVLHAYAMETAKAETACRRILSEYRDHPAAGQARVVLAAAYEIAGRYGDAIAAYGRLTADAPHYHADIGRCAELAGNVERAKAAYTAYLEAGLAGPQAGLVAARLAAVEAGDLLEEPPTVKPPAAPRIPDLTTDEPPAPSEEAPNLEETTVLEEATDEPAAAAEGETEPAAEAESEASE